MTVNGRSYHTVEHRMQRFRNNGDGSIPVETRLICKRSGDIEKPRLFARCVAK